MASTASGSQPLPSATVQSTSNLEERPQAGPLPVKQQPLLVGEIGYQAISEARQGEQLQDVSLEDGAGGAGGAGGAAGGADVVDPMEGLNAAEADALNGRHPADRSQVNLASRSTVSLSAPSTSDAGSRHNPSDSIVSVNTTTKRSIFSFPSFSSKAFHGVTFDTIIRILFILIITAALIGAWIIAAIRLNKLTASSDAINVAGPGTSSIFIHVAFAIVILILLILLERTVFRLRAERYAHLHPGEIHPSMRHRGGAAAPGRPSPGIAFAPWNRPPLPTYAAALGVRGTGDVEDNAIAAPPPPAYGNTRGSTLLLSSSLFRSLSRARSAREDDAVPMVERRRNSSSSSSSSRGVRAPSRTSARSAPLISYDEVELEANVERARVLEETLARLDGGGGSADAGPSSTQTRG